MTPNCDKNCALDPGNDLLSIRRQIIVWNDADFLQILDNRVPEFSFKM